MLIPGLLSSPPWPQLRPGWFSGWQWAGSLTLTETWREHVIGGPRGHFPGQAWTLCYEEQFYAVTGLLLWLVPQRLFAGATVLTAVVAAIVVTSATYNWPTSGFFFDGSWFMFAAGIAVYYSLEHATPSIGGLLVGLVAGCGAVLWRNAREDWGGALVFAGVLLAIHRWDAAIVQTPIGRALGWCGTMCYSLYLVHQTPVKAVSAYLHRVGLSSPEATLLIVLPLSVATALTLGQLFYVLVERRFLNSRQRTYAMSGRLAAPRATVQLQSGR